MPKAYVIREMPSARDAFMRFQVGIAGARKERALIYHNDKFHGYSKCTVNTQIFHLIGYGETLAIAEARAQDWKLKHST